MLILTKGLDGNGISREHSKRGLVYLVISLFTSAIAAISSKFAAMYVGKLSFLAIVYTIAALSSLTLTKKLKTSDFQVNKPGTIVIGVTMGILNFVGYYAFLMALSKGPLPLVASITGMHFVISIILSILIYRERLTAFRVIGFLLTIVSIILLRL
jgi:drug/metabolite transporter (DMT)-like permease